MMRDQHAAAREACAVLPVLELMLGALADHHNASEWKAIAEAARELRDAALSLGQQALRSTLPGECHTCADFAAGLVFLIRLRRFETAFANLLMDWAPSE